ncbi:MAG: biotin transporter BioY [Clostridiales bacterium]|jgi:biotin transport system substrate-specific component|nr:biotin transporter BioY [Clostridiales bacterium]
MSLNLSNNYSTARLVLCAFFAALGAALSQVSIPIGPIPITCTHLSIFLAAGMLGAKYAAASQAIFVSLGAIGLPVFSGFSGGIGVIAGPRGGFILGYIACAWLAGFMMDCMGRTAQKAMLAMLAGLLVNYGLGIAWYIFVSQAGFGAALTVCILPFLPGDALKIVLSAILVKRLRRAAA